MIKNWGDRIRLGLVMLGLAPGLAWADRLDPTGNWVRDSGTVRMAVTQCGTNYCAVNTWVKRPDGPEKKGDELILTVKPVSSGKFQGSAYDVRRHRTYGMTITFQDDNDMQTSGCILFGVICKSTSWRRES